MSGESSRADACAFDAVVLAGGAGRRMGGVDKAAVRLQGVRLVDRVAHAAQRAGAAGVTIVGPESTAADDCARVREDPPGGGPLAAVAAALPLVEHDWTMLLSCDLQQPAAVCRALMAALREDFETEGIVLVDQRGRHQWLAGVYSTHMLRRSLGTLGHDPAGLPVKLLFANARLREVPVANAIAADIDTPEDLAEAMRLNLE